MTNKYLISIFCLVLAIPVIGWGIFLSMGRQGISTVVHAIPIIRFERFDASRNSLIIALFNPGQSPVEIDRTELIYQSNGKNPRFTFDVQEYGDKPLVLDPEDTILVPLKNITADNSHVAESESMWGILDFRIPGQNDFYRLHHRFEKNLF